MEELNIEATPSTPKVFGDPKSHTLSFSGESYPDIAPDFYKPIIDWLERYLQEFNDPMDVHFELMMTSSSSIRQFYKIFGHLDKAREKGKVITINWYYDPENDTAKENGSDFSSEYDSLNFNIIEKKS